MYDNGGTPEVKKAEQESNGSVELKQDSSKGEDSATAKKPEGTDKTQDSGKTKGGYDADTAWNRRPIVQFQGYDVPPFRDRGQKTSVTPSISFGRGLGVKPVARIQPAEIRIPPVSVREQDEARSCIRDGTSGLGGPAGNRQQVRELSNVRGVGCRHLAAGDRPL
jgi:hypothetical protein